MASAELLRRLLRDCPAGGDQAEYVAKRLERIKRLKVAAAEIDRKEQEARGELKQRLVTLERERESLRLTCLHEETDYQRDPSGGGDSVTVCLICGKTWDHSVGGYDG
jgi:ABC-type phosphate transport system auxiliary subunit